MNPALMAADSLLRSGLMTGSDTADAVELALNLGVPVCLVVLGLVVGGRRERAHFRDLERREAATAQVPRSDLRTYGDDVDPAAGAVLVSSEVTIAADYCKALLAGLRKLVGGNVRAYETLMERARREALLRLVESAGEQGFDALCCIRFETASIGKGTMPMVCVVAQATAYRRRRA